jgi:hypothetical protein
MTSTKTTAAASPIKLDPAKILGGVQSAGQVAAGTKQLGLKPASR